MLRHTDSFDDRATANIGSKYNNTPSATISAGNGRTGVAGMFCNSVGVAKTFDNQTKWTVGMAVKFSGTMGATNYLASMLDGATAQITFVLTAAGFVEARRGSSLGTLLGTSSSAITSGSFHYIEVQSTINNSGTAIVKFNGVIVLNLSGVDTQASANAYASVVQVGYIGAATITYIDDLYICDGSGTANTDFLGDVSVEAIFPNADGTYLQWATSTGVTHYTLIDDNPPNSDTDYVLTSGVGNIDTYGFTNLTVLSGTIMGIQMNYFARKDDAGTRTITPIWFIGGVVYSGDTGSLGSAYVYSSFIKETDPSDSTAWTIEDINTNTEFGAKLVA